MLGQQEGISWTSDNRTAASQSRKYVRLLYFSSSLLKL